MSDNPGGGIGRSPEFWPDDPVERKVPRHDPEGPVVPDSERDPPQHDVVAMVRAALVELRADSEQMRADTAAYGTRLAEVEAKLEQAQGQLAQVEMAFGEYRQAFQTVFARLDALAQQIARNLRYAALEVATKSRQPGEQGNTVVRNARDYLAFLDPPAEVAAPVPEGGETTH